MSRDRCTGLGCGIEDGLARDMNVYLNRIEKVGLKDTRHSRSAGRDGFNIGRMELSVGSVVLER